MNTSRTTIFIVSALLASVALSGCNRSSGIAGVGSGSSRAQLPPPPLQPAPTQPVQGQELAPPPGTAAQAQVGDPQFDANGNPINGAGALGDTPGVAEPDTQIASVDPTETKPAGQSVTKEAVLGAWDLSAGGGSCKLILSLTQNADKTYRAAPLRCPSPEITNAKAWNVVGNQVVLYDGAGSPVARINRTGDASYSGSTNGGTAVSLSR